MKVSGICTALVVVCSRVMWPSSMGETQIEFDNNPGSMDTASSQDSKNIPLVLSSRHEARRTAGPLLLGRPHLVGGRRAVDHADPARVLPRRAPLRPISLEA